MVMATSQLATQQPSPADPQDLSQRAHRIVIGVLGCILPPVLYVVAGLRETAGLTPWVRLNSISAYYYTGAVGIFVGVIFALSLFLLTYRGYAGEWADRIVGGLAGLAALGVVVFPTRPPGSVQPPDWWSEAAGHLHYASAVVLFLCFIVFAVWLFRKSSISERAGRPPEKRYRDDICLACGVAMAIGIAWAGISLLTGENSIFFQETVAIEAFAISWLAKGEVHEPVLRFVKRRRLRRGQSGSTPAEDSARKEPAERKTQGATTP